MRKIKCEHCNTEFDAKIDMTSIEAAEKSLKEIKCPKCGLILHVDMSDLIDFSDINKEFHANLDNGYYRAHLYEVLYCHRNGLGLYSLQGWIELEQVIQQNIEFDTYKQIDTELSNKCIDTAKLQETIDSCPFCDVEARKVINKVLKNK